MQKIVVKQAKYIILTLYNKDFNVRALRYISCKKVDSTVADVKLFEGYR